jgi:hypothetical protein
MTEAPLVYPCQDLSPRRYVVGEDRKLGRVAVEDVAPSSLDLPLEDALPGAASVSELQLQGKSVIVTTSALLESPDIISVALSWTADALESPAMLQLDLRSLGLSRTVKIQAFSHVQNCVRLVVVDCSGTLVSMIFTQTFLPLDQPVKVLRSSDYMQEQPVIDEITGSELQSTMAVFVSPTVVVLALSPFCVTVDIESETSSVWSETQCLEDMRSRTTSLGNLLSHASDMLLGKLEVGIMDMPPTAALCVSSTSNVLLDSTFIFTLHSDASIRKWRFDPEVSLLPMEVTMLEPPQLPHPSTWSDTRNAVSLCARLYSEIFALAVHIKTNGGYEEDKEFSDCHLWIIHGNQSGESNVSCLPLNVPKEALSLVGIAFNPTHHRCTLSVLFTSSEDDDRTASIQLVYPPSVVSILSTQPIITSQGSLDTTATQERARIRALHFGPDLLEESTSAATSEQDLHQLDTYYMKYLFRPMYPRGTGTTLPPSQDCIRKALTKLVHGTRREPGMSLELETLRGIYEWRNKENRRLVAMTPVRKQPQSPKTPTTTTSIGVLTSPFSVYETFVQSDDEEDMVMDDSIMDMADEMDQERATELEAHENRWRRFLLQVWEEEQILRLPLAVLWLETIRAQVVVRAGITTVIQETAMVGEPDMSSPWAVFDDAALKLLERIEKDKSKSGQLYLVEQQVAGMVANASLAVLDKNRSKAFLEELEELGQWAWAEEGGISDAEHEQLEQAVSELTVEQLVDWLQETPKDSTGSLVGLDMFGGQDANNSSGRVTWSQSQVANCQLRHSACSLSVRCIDSVRRLQLSRCLLLADLIQGSHATDAALRAYLHSIAVLWTAAQRVPMPSTALKTKRRGKVNFGESPDSSSPPNKRLSFGDDASSILEPLSSTMTTTLDVQIINISQTMDGTSSVLSSPVGAAVLMGQSFFRLALSSGINNIPGKSALLPELGALPPPRDENIPTDYPRLALRLLAPFVAFTLPEESSDVITARKETLAECLLIESHAESSNNALQMRMRQRACDLLVPKGSDHDRTVDEQKIRHAFDALNHLKSFAPPTSNTRSFQDALASRVQRLLYGEKTGIAIEIRRLCELETIKSIFAPLVSDVEGDMDGMTRASVHLLASIMLRLSRLMHRLTILERHVGNPSQVSAEGSNESSGMLLEFIVSAIEEMKALFPSDVCREMPEFVNLWSRLFHHAVLAGRWEQAYEACISNPVSERRDSNFKRLVRAMVDSGALQDLLEKCTQVSVRNSEEEEECVDLYEIASEILAEAISRDVYTARAASAEPSGLSDYQGALYSLHASQKQWRRAAQGMDLRFINARSALGAKSTDLNLNLGSAVLRDGLIVEDLVLAAVSSVNATELVSDSAHRFLVSGERGPYHSIPIDGFEESQYLDSRIKRTRGSQDKEDATDEDADGEDRLSKFMTLTELEGRAIRSIALRTLFFDGSSDPSYAKASFQREFDTSSSDIDELFKNGHYRHGLLLAKAMSKNYEAINGSSRPEGRDLFYDSVGFLLYTYLVPLAAQGALLDPNLSRPSLQQLHIALDDVGVTQGTASYVSTERTKKRSNLQAAAVSAASMALLRKLTIAHSTAETPVALDVATFFLDLDGHYACLPAWLERLLVGADACSANPSTGLFARRPTPGSGVYLGDPSALVTLYTKRGMYAEACEVVSATLTGLDGHDSGGGSREAKAPNRLPEKGEIDFVPYQKIDILWNLIDFVLNDGRVDKREGDRMRESRKNMEQAIEKHIALMKISEMGMRSARALKQGMST